MHRPLQALPLLAALTLLGAACTDGAFPVDFPGNADRAWAEEYGIPYALDAEGPAFSAKNNTGPAIAWESTDTVWVIEHQWTQVTSESGVAWSANSGLDWEQKYTAWVQSLPTTTREAGGTTFEVTTPYGVTLSAPVLECAEVAIFLRAAFASWYGLPFYLKSWSNGQAVYLGHSGFRNADGSRFGGTPNFRNRYTDYTDHYAAGDDWPSDGALRSRGLYGGGDEVPFLPDVDGEPARAGAYFDAMFLNKRTGHFMLLALAWFGSINLASESNLMPIEPEATRAGDVLLHRWQGTGIGHTLPVMRTEEMGSDALEVALASGSMPRRQPVWEERASVLWYFTSDFAGGPGSNGDGDDYAELGGGIRRWRVPTKQGSIYLNSTASNSADYVAATNTAAIAARPARFGQLLGAVSPQDLRDAALGRIASSREHLGLYPASCAARERREEAFETLYRVMNEHFGLDKGQVDARYRGLDDYVFAELEYTVSRSCCWNSTTQNMYEIVMAFAYAEQQAAEQAGECIQPTVFKGRNHSGSDDGFTMYRSYAESLGRGDQWVDWSADETCAQADVANDTETAHEWTPWCDIPAVSDPGGGDDPGGDDPGGGDPPAGGDPDDGPTITPPDDCGTCSASDSPAEPALWLAVWLGHLVVGYRRRVRVAR